MTQKSYRPDPYDDEADKAPPPTKEAVITMFATVADTSWRLFTPTLGGVILGIWLDKRFDTIPLFTIAGVLLGTSLAFMLVYIQIRGVNKTDSKSGS